MQSSAFDGLAEGKLRFLVKNGLELHIYPFTDVQNTLKKYVRTAIAELKVSPDNSDEIRSLEDTLKAYVDARVSELKTSLATGATLASVQGDLEQLKRKLDEAGFSQQKRTEDKTGDDLGVLGTMLGALSLNDQDKIKHGGLKMFPEDPTANEKPDFHFAATTPELPSHSHPVSYHSSRCTTQSPPATNTTDSNEDSDTAYEPWSPVIRRTPMHELFGRGTGPQRPLLPLEPLQNFEAPQIGVALESIETPTETDSPTCTAPSGPFSAADATRADNVTVVSTK